MDEVNRQLPHVRWSVYYLGFVGMFVNVSIAAFAKHKRVVLLTSELRLLGGTSLFVPPLSGYFND